MNIFLSNLPFASSYITLGILVFCFLLHYMSFGIRVLLHPTIWFFLVWILSLISLIITLHIGFDFIVVYKKHFNLLLTYVSFTAISIVVIGFFNKNLTKKKTIKWKPRMSYMVFKFLSVIVFVFASSIFLLTRGFDLVSNREQAIQNVYELSSGKSVSIFDYIQSFMLHLNIPLIVYSGYVIGIKSIKKKQLNILIFIPFVTEVIKTLYIGGRAGIVTAVGYLILGLSLSYFSNKIDTLKLLNKLKVYGIVLILSFSLFSTYINAIRGGGYDKSEQVMRYKDYPSLQRFSGIIEYLISHYMGFQFRMEDKVTKKLELGQISLSGITMFSIPLVSRLTGERASIQTLFNLKEIDTVKETKETAAKGSDWAYSTATIYLNLYDDYGYYGTFIAILVFILVSQFYYNRLFNKKRTSFLYLLPFLLISFLWQSTIFSHTTNGNWISTFVYSFIIIDIITFIFRKKRTNEKNSVVQ